MYLNRDKVQTAILDPIETDNALQIAEKEELPERSDAAANFLRGFGRGGWNFLLLILTIVQFLLALFLDLGRLFDRLGGGRLCLQSEDRQSLSVRSQVGTRFKSRENSRLPSRLVSFRRLSALAMTTALRAGRKWA